MVESLISAGSAAPAASFAPSAHWWICSRATALLFRERELRFGRRSFLVSVVLFYSGVSLGAVAANIEKLSSKPVARIETFKDLIEKAQNLTLQQDRLQTSQVLIRGIQKENKNSVAYHELARALESLTSLFYSEKAHALFSSAQSMAQTKPKEAADLYVEALRLEDSNLSLIKGLARAQLNLADCGKADSTTLQAEGVDPYSLEVKLLRLQVLACQKSFASLKALLATESVELEPVQKFARGLEVESALFDASQSSPADFKKSKSLLAAWESKDSEYPELYFWRWKYNQALAADDDGELPAASSAALSVGSIPALAQTHEMLARSAALKYTQKCQGLTPRKRQSYEFDVRMCRGVDEVDAYLKASGSTPTPAPHLGESSKSDSAPELKSTIQKGNEK